jgi:hypothetical protein
MNDVFFVGAYWNARREILEDVIQPTLEVLERLSEFDEQFLTFYELGYSRKSALENKVLLNVENIKELYKKGHKKKDIDSFGYSGVGFNLSLWTGQRDRESSSLSFRVGKNSDKVSNSCLISLPAEGVAKDRLLHFNKAKIILDLLIEAWDPDTVVLTSRKLSDSLTAITDVGWMTYKKLLEKNVRVIDNIIHDPYYKGGHLFYLKTNNEMAYDYDMIDDLLSFKKNL